MFAKASTITGFSMLLTWAFPLSVFNKQNINVVPGMQVNVDNLIGIVRVISGGRVITDFNPPLAGRDLSYDIIIRRVIGDKKEKILSLFDIIGMKADAVLDGNNAVIKIKHDIPNEIKEQLMKKIKKLVELEKVEFVKETTTQE